MEIELKYGLDAAKMTNLISNDFFIKHLIPGSEQTLNLISTYYDSPDRRLELAGITYRVRETTFADGHKEYESTTKRTVKKAGALAVREEINEKQTDNQPKYTDVKVLFSTIIERKTFLLKFAGAKFEMALDKGEIRTGDGKTEPISEVEFELKEGNESGITLLQEYIARELHLQAEERSKFARGKELMQK